METEYAALEVSPREEVVEATRPGKGVGSFVGATWNFQQPLSLKMASCIPSRIRKPNPPVENAFQWPARV
jgi:hypothetical protein